MTTDFWKNGKGPAETINVPRCHNLRPDVTTQEPVCKAPPKPLASPFKKRLCSKLMRSAENSLPLGTCSSSFAELGSQQLTTDTGENDMAARERAHAEITDQLGDLIEGWLSVLRDLPQEFVERAAEHFYNMIV